MKNFYKKGNMLTYFNTGSAIASGAVVPISGIGVGIAAVDIAATTGEGEIAIEGVFKVAKTTSQAWAQGARLYWDPGTSKFTTTAGSLQLAGFVYKAAGSSDTVGYIRLVPMGDSDPGNLAQAAFVAFSAGADLVGVDGTGSNAAPLAGTETRLDSLDTAVAAIISSLVAAGLMAAS
jgi:predicted RecA/RadA family phage recombinase